MGRNSYLGGSSLVHVSTAKSNLRGGRKGEATDASPDLLKLRQLNERISIQLAQTAAVDPTLKAQWREAYSACNGDGATPTITAHRVSEVEDLATRFGFTDAVERLSSLPGNAAFTMSFLEGHDRRSTAKMAIALVSVSGTDVIFARSANEISGNARAAGWLDGDAAKALLSSLADRNTNAM